MPEFEDVRLYYTEDLQKLLGCDRHKIYQFIKSGLLKCRKVGRSWASSGDEIKEFYRVTQGMDLSNDKKIILAGQFLRKQKSGRCADRTAINRCS